jgi:hypothetical protein
VEEGMQQGDPLGSFGFSAGAQSLLAFCNEIAAGDRSIDIDVEDLCEEGIESLATSHQPTNLEMRDDDETQHTQPQTEKKGFCAMYIDPTVQIIDALSQKCGHNKRLEVNDCGILFSTQINEYQLLKHIYKNI